MSDDGVDEFLIGMFLVSLVVSAVVLFLKLALVGTMGIAVYYLWFSPGP